MTTSKAAKPLFDRNFTLLWLGRAVSQMGDGAGYIGLMWWVASQEGSSMLLGLLAACRTIAAIVFSLIAGVVADRANKRDIIVAMDALRGVFYGVMGYLILRDQMTVPILLGLAVANTVCAQFFDPAVTSAVPLIVDKSNLARANSFTRMTGNIAEILSYGAGGVLVAVFGVAGLLFVDAVSYILSAISEVFIVIPEVRRQEAKKNRFFQEFKDGLAYTMSNKVLWETVKVAAVLNLLMAPVSILLPEFVKTNLGGDSALFGYLTSAVAAGVLISAILISATRFVERNTWTVIHGLTIQSACILVFAFAPKQYPYIHVAILLVFGVLNGIVNIYVNTLVQKVSAPEQLGRVTGVLNAVCMGLQPVSQGLSGYLGTRVPLQYIYAFCAVGEGIGGWRFSVIPNLKALVMNSDNDMSVPGDSPAAAANS